jgi:predicted nucleotidyltransferase
VALSIPPERAVPEATVAILRHMAAAAEAQSRFDPELAGARLLGRDAVRLCGAEVTRGVLERMSASLRLELENQLLRQAVLLDEDAAQVRTHRLLDGFWSELRAAVA